MKNVNVGSLVYGFLIVLNLISPIRISAQEVSAEYFQKTLKNCVSRIQNETSTAYTNVMGDKTFIELEKTSPISWNVQFKGGIYKGDYFYSKVTNGSIFNGGKEFKVEFYSYPVPDLFYQKIINHPEVEHMVNWLKKQSPSSVLSVKKVENSAHYTIIYTYESGERYLEKHLYAALNTARTMVDQFMKAEDELSEEIGEILSSEKIRPMTNDELILLLQDKSLYRVFFENAAAVGAWEFSKNEVDYELLNFKDRVEMVVSGYVFDQTDDQKEQVMVQMKQWAESEKLDGATQVIVEWDPDDEDQETLRIRSLFQFNGTIKGKDLRETYESFYEDFGDKFLEKLEELAGE